MEREKLTNEKPGPWGTAGSLVNLRLEIEGIFRVADALKTQCAQQNLYPQDVLSRVKILELSLSRLKTIAEDPTKFS